MKSALRWVARKAGYDLVRHVRMPERPFNVLQLVIDARVAAGRPVRFVQVGANDGVWNDPLRESVLRHRLPGLLVEPIPDLFDRLRANYAGHPGAAFERCAVGGRDGEATLYRVAENSGLPAWVQGLASFDRGHLSARKFGVPGLERHVLPVVVPVLTLPSLLAKHGLGGCDLLQIDTEGLDCQIVHWAIEAGLRPAIINYEYIHVDPAARVRCKALLADHGYAFLDVGRDTLAVREA